LPNFDRRIDSPRTLTDAQDRDGVAKEESDLEDSKGEAGFKRGEGEKKSKEGLDPMWSFLWDNEDGEGLTRLCIYLYFLSTLTNLST
jgi:hypothetical protein